MPWIRNTVGIALVCYREKTKYENGPYKPWGDFLKNVAEVGHGDF